MDFTTSVWLSAAIAVVLCVVNVVVGYAVARYAFSKEWEAFVGLVVGGMAGRVALVGVGVWYCVSVLGVHLLSFSMTLGIGSFIFIFAEIIYFHILSGKNPR